MDHAPLDPPAGLTAHDQLDMLWREHEYLQDQAKFADEKAARVITWNIAIIAGLYAAELFPLGLEQLQTPGGIMSAGVLLICLFSLLFAASVVHPRVPAPKGVAPAGPREPGWIFFGDLSAHGTGENYHHHLAADPHRLVRELCDQCLTMSRIVATKHGHARSATQTLLIAVFAAAARVVFV